LGLMLVIVQWRFCSFAGKGCSHDLFQPNVSMTS
jgi:hypothetical protein